MLRTSSTVVAKPRTTSLTRPFVSSERSRTSQRCTPYYSTRILSTTRTGTARLLFLPAVHILTSVRIAGHLATGHCPAGAPAAPSSSMPTPSVRPSEYRSTSSRLSRCTTQRDPPDTVNNRRKAPLPVHHATGRPRADGRQNHRARSFVSCGPRRSPVGSMRATDSIRRTQAPGRVLAQGERRGTSNLPAGVITRWTAAVTVGPSVRTVCRGMSEANPCSVARVSVHGTRRR